MTGSFENCRRKCRIYSRCQLEYAL